jgi:RNA polymerase sigma-70 factor (ECF subfamily)
MTSEAAYFPDTLATSVNEREFLDRKAQSSADSPEDQVHSARTGSVVDTSAPITELSDEVLLEQIGFGIREALAILFRRYARVVRTIAHRILRDASEAEDLLQEVFLYIFRKAELFDSAKGSARSWIVQVTYHRAIDRRRHLISRHFYHAVDLETSAATALYTEIAFYEQSLEGMVGKETMARIEESLSEDQRRTLQLFFFEGYTIEEIAQERGESPGNIRHHYYRALEKMRKLIFTPKLASK